MMKISTFACLALLLHGGMGTPRTDPSLMKALQRGGTANIGVTMKDSTSSVLEGFNRKNFATRGDRITAIATELQELAATSQANVISFLEEELSRADGNCSYRSFWISNKIFIRGASQEVVKKLGDFNEIESIAEERTLEVGEPASSASTYAEMTYSRDAEEPPTPRAWNVYQIHAPEVWETEGNTGAGVVVGTISSGVRFTHEALRNNFRRDHGWLDYLGRTQEPSDDANHGTRLMGPIAGAYEIGVAPGSLWIACKACGSSGCGEEALLGCGQWMLCPTDPQGEHPNCSMAPQILSNGWDIGTSDSWYKPVTDAWFAAGIIAIFRAGNHGRDDCSSLTSPGDYETVIAVGATSQQTILSNFSSLGPSNLTSEFKPDVIAPGEYIRSAGSDSDTHYSLSAGTGFAASHVAGTVALMLASRPQDRPCFEKVRTALRESSEQVASKRGRCGGVPDDQWPNYHHGYGFINALRAVQIYKNMTASCP